MIDIEELDTLERDYSFTPAQKMILQAVRESVERYTQIRDQLSEEGLMIEGRYAEVKRLNPLAGLESQARAAMIRALRALSMESLYKHYPDGDESGID